MDPAGDCARNFVEMVPAAARLDPRAAYAPSQSDTKAPLIKPARGGI